MRKKPRPNCMNCGKEVNRGGCLYCSNKCQLDFQYKLWVEAWLMGALDKTTSGNGVSGHIRRFFMEKTSSKCQKCGWGEINQKSGTIPLEMNHIDGNWLNNHIDNLELICPNCHSLTHNHKALNRGRGRIGR